MKTKNQRFWCDDCQDWTLVAGTEDWADEPDEDDARCAQCDEPFRCGECGYEIDKKGACQRPPNLGVCPEAKPT